ncbi:MAG: hypothetical protein HY422_00505 [Candidatus Komeilibacteria bacterium]|nr:hypothetical protein [Candidatus Komeilibacteria bacterium]
MDQQPPPSDIFARHIIRKMWWESIVFGLLLFSAFVILTSVLDGGLHLLTISKALAGASALLIGSSFALSGFCYYFDFLDTKIAYRKYLGLVGYYFALLYSVSLLAIDPDRYFYGFFENFLSADILLGLISMTFLTYMALISKVSIMKKMGPHRWRVALRLGYVAWVLLVVRAYILERYLWTAWLSTWNGFPPPRLLLSLFVVAVIFFRISISVSKYVRRSRAAKPVDAAPDQSHTLTS